MPFTLIAALFVAFGIDPGPSAAVSLSRPALYQRAFAAFGGVALVAGCAAVVGWWVSLRVHRRGYVSAGVRQTYFWGTRLVALLALAVYAATLHLLGWRAVARAVLGGRDWPLVSDVLVLLPFLLAEVAGWCGLFPGEQALRLSRTGKTLGLQRHLTLKARQVLGLLLPVLLVYSLGQDVAARLLPDTAGNPWAQLVGLAAMAALVLAASPLFLRIAWPTYPLPRGPLRQRLESLAHRVGFRCTDILVWDTGGMLVNAGVTGTLPWFRYVLLSDALLDNLTPPEVSAVFGHEIGHIAHRHLLSFGLFFVGTIGVMAVISGVLDQYVLASLGRSLATRYASLNRVMAAGATLLALGLYFFVAFGLASRRFERQADLFGCRAVSCGGAACPPHREIDESSRHADRVCPAGIRTFVDALTNVAALNGMGRHKPSWRHGSIARRVAFLESLEGRPDLERRFQRGVVALHVALVIVLSLAWTWAVTAHWLERF